jgi:alpha-tubulin suppressor-like RCC1 family protein
MRKLAPTLAGLIAVLVAVTACQPAPTTTTTTTTTTASPPTNARPVQLDVSTTHGCAAYDDGTVRCFGNNRNGQLGDGTATGMNGIAPSVKVSGLTDATQVAVGNYSSCALRRGGTVSCWGLGSHGQLGNGSTAQSNVPVPVTGITDATSVTLTQSTFPAACASLASGAVSCWGSNLRGNLGTDDVASAKNVHAATPVTAEGVTGAVQVSAGGNSVCALLTSGGASCWGDNQAGQLGNPSVPTNLAGGSTSSHMSALPVPVVGLSGATAIVAGQSHVCTKIASGPACWGSNGSGQLGTGANSSIEAPTVSPIGGHTFSSLTAGGATCGLEGTTAWCWGPDTTAGNGQLGSSAVPPFVPDGTLRPRHSTVPLRVDRVTQPIQVIENGSGTTCAALADRSIRCWGSTPHGSLPGAPAPI